MRVSVKYGYKFLLVFTLETLVLSSLTIVVIQVGSAAPQSTSCGIALDNITIVAVHHFDRIENNNFWRNIVNKLHIQFIDRATGLMEGADWFKPRVDAITIASAKSMGILTGSYMILTPIPPIPEPLYLDPYGKSGKFTQIAGGRDLDGNLLFHTDGFHLTVSPSCPQWLNHYIESTKKIIDAGLDAIDIDNIAYTPFIRGGDFSEWSVYNFRSHLASRFSSEQLEQLGIHNVTAFDIREYIKSKNSLKSFKGEILVIAAPTTSLSREEIEAIKTFVQNGGGLLVQLEPSSCQAANRLLSEFGISARCGNLISSKYLWDPGSFEIKRLKTNHPVMLGVKSIVLNWGVALDIKNPNASILAETDENAWVDKNGDLKLNPNEERGPFPVVASLEYGQGRLLVQGDRTQDTMFYANEQFLRNALLWLGKGSVSGKTLVFSEVHGEEASTSCERARLINVQHPEWYCYSLFTGLAERLGLKVVPLRGISFPDDPILREYVKFQHSELIRFIKRVSESVKEYGRTNYGKDVPVFGNQWLGVPIDGNFLKDVALDSILLSPYVDLIQIETTPALPPENRLGLLYRIGHAMAQNQKAVWALGAFCSNYSRPLNHDKVNLTVLVIAEAYAHGAIKELDLSGSPEFTPIAGTVVHPVTLSVPRRIQALVDFIWSYRDLLTGFKPYAKIAVVYSVPTFLWATFPAFNLYPEEQRGELIGIADMLQKLHLPYEVLIFGHPDLFNDSYYLGKLEQYDLVILPHVTHISEDQLNAIENFLKAGGKIVFTGGLPTRDHEHNPLTGRTAERMAALLNKHPGRVLLVDEKIGLDWFYGSKDRKLLLTNFQKVLETVLGRLPIKLEGATDSVEVSLLKKQGVTALHLINYQYELGNDSFKQLGNISILIDESLIGEARNTFYISPELMQKLEISRKDTYLKITVPLLSCWGFIAFNLPPRLKVYEITVTPLEVASKFTS
ncbi:MAG: hypothetical protein QXJ59_09330 [Thermofilaceae archaeon]